MPWMLHWGEGVAIPFRYTKNTLRAAAWAQPLLASSMPLTAFSSPLVNKEQYSNQQGTNRHSWHGSWPCIWNLKCFPWNKEKGERWESDYASFSLQETGTAYLAPIESFALLLCCVKGFSSALGGLWKHCPGGEHGPPSGSGSCFCSGYCY